MIPPVHSKEILRASNAAADNAVFVKCKINNIGITALIDTGASVTIIRADIFNRIRTRETELRRTNQIILGANNDPLELCCTTDVEIQLGKTSVKQEVRVCKNLSQTVLIGVDFLKPQGCVVDFNSGHLNIAGEKIEMSCNESWNVCRVTVRETRVIPPRTMINVSCRCVENGPIENMVGILEPEERFEERHKAGIIKVAATVIDGCIPVRIFNADDVAKRIYRGSNVGLLYPICDAPTVDKGNESCYQVVRTVKETDKDLHLKVKELFPIHNASLTEGEIDSVHKVLAKHVGAISLGKNDLGDVATFNHSIETGDAAPIHVPMRRAPFHNRHVVQEEIDSMLNADVIEPSNSLWSAPVVMVKKKDGTNRFCIDYRKLNAITKKDVHPLPRCEETLEAMNGTKYFSHLVLVRGYWQIRVKEEDKEMTAFSTPNGHYHFKRMPFGLTNAPATFQRAMNTILKGLTWVDCLVYLDDIVIFAKTLQDHNRKLDQVLTRLEDLDIVGPLPSTKSGNRFILVIVDYFTRWPEAYAMPD